MRVRDVTVSRSPREELFAYGDYSYDLETSYRLRRGAATAVETKVETKVETAETAALQKVEEAGNNNMDATLDMMDRHNEMVKKSQELYKAKAKQRAIERQNIERREKQRELLAEMALNNARQRDFLKSARF